MLQKNLLIIVFTLISFMLVGCWEDSLLDRSLIFSTHTTLGIEVAVSPAETSSPARIIIGYKRTEGVINPVYHSKGIETSTIKETTEDDGKTTIETTPCGTSRYKEEAYSVIAKFSGETGAKADRAAEGKLSVAQWFATGEAAKTLARQPGIAGAVTGSSEIAKAAAQGAAGLSKLRGEHRSTVFSLLTIMYTRLDKIAEDSSNPDLQLDAKEIKASLESAPVLNEIDYKDFVRYEYDYQNKKLKKPGIGSSPPGFYKATSYRSELQKSIDYLKVALAERELKDEKGDIIEAKERGTYLNELIAQKKKLDELDEKLLNDSAVLEMIRFFFGD